MSPRSVQVLIVNDSIERDAIAVALFKSDPGAPSQQPLLAWEVIPYMYTHTQAMVTAEEGEIYIAVLSPTQIRDGKLVESPVFRGKPTRFDLNRIARIEIVIRGGGEAPPPPPPPPPPPFDFETRHVIHT
jgi:hypothetical protein